jgi:hypothetical protein
MAAAENESACRPFCESRITNYEWPSRMTLLPRASRSTFMNRARHGLSGARRSPPTEDRRPGTDWGPGTGVFLRRHQGHQEDLRFGEEGKCGRGHSWLCGELFQPGARRRIATGYLLPVPSPKPAAGSRQRAIRSSDPTRTESRGRSTGGGTRPDSCGCTAPSAR